MILSGGRSVSAYQELLEKRAVLERQQAEVNRALAEARREARAGVIAEIKSLMAEHGLTAADLGAISSGKRQPAQAGKKGGSVPPKYQHPTTGQTWTGCGLQPNWLKAELSAGRSLSDFLIAQPA